MATDNICTTNLVKFGHVVPEIFSHTNTDHPHTKVRSLTILRTPTGTAVCKS